MYHTHNMGILHIQPVWVTFIVVDSIIMGIDNGFECFTHSLTTKQPLNNTQKPSGIKSGRTQTYFKLEYEHLSLRMLSAHEYS